MFLVENFLSSKGRTILSPKYFIVMDKYLNMSFTLSFPKTFKLGMECDILVDMARENLQESVTGTIATGGAKKSRTRTSRNGW